MTLILLLFLASCAPSHQKNTTLQPIVLSGQEIEVVLKEIEGYEPKYDSTVHLVWATQARHYHSDFQEETKIHSVRSSLGYAEALLNSQKPEFREHAFDVLRAVIALQDQDTESKTCGVWPYSLEEPLATKKSPADRNWADFSAVPIIGIINNHSNILPDYLKENTRKALLLASQAIRKRDVRPDYTNIYGRRVLPWRVGRNFGEQQCDPPCVFVRLRRLGFIHRRRFNRNFNGK